MSGRQPSGSVPGRRGQGWRETPPRLMSGEGFQAVMESVGFAGAAAQQTEQEALIDRLQADRERLSTANGAAIAEITHLRGALGRLEAEKSVLEGRVEEQRQTMRRLEDQLSKQKVTIKVQSDQIAATTTPSRAGPSVGAGHSTYGQPPPSYAPRPSSTTPSRRSGPPPPTTPISRRQNSQTPTPTHSHSGPPRIMPPRTPHPAQAGSQLAEIQEAEPSIELSSEFTRIFRLTETWTRNYANIPQPQNDRALSADLKTKFVQYTSPDTAQKLLSSSTTRYLLIAKLMNIQLTTLALRPLIAKGYTPYYDKKITEMRAGLQHQIPIHIRRGLMTACSMTFLEITNTEGWPDHIRNLVGTQVRAMWLLLEPLLNKDIARNEAWRDLCELWDEACKVGTLMLLKPSQWTLDYPPTGPNSVFNPAQMLNRDVNFTQDPKTLSSMGVTVRLAITPVVTETNFMSDNTTPRILHHANVLLQ